MNIPFAGFDDLPRLAPQTDGFPPADVPAALSDALASLALNPGEELTVLVNDPQRHTATGTVLAALAGSVAPARTRILVATGTHRFESGDRAGFERTIAGHRSYRQIAWHDASADGLKPLGPCRSAATPSAESRWRVHPWLIGGGKLLAIGSVEPHYFAGFTGAHKTCTIGVASRADIEANHAFALSTEAGPGRLGGNPVHEGIAAAVIALEQAAPLACVNLVQAGPVVLAAAGGGVLETLETAADCARRAFIHSIPAPVDGLVLSVEGPLSRTFYQADKGIKNSEQAVTDGGAMVLVAACEDGIGQDQFVRLLQDAPTCAGAKALVARRRYRLGDHKAVKLRQLTDPAERGVRVWAVCPGLDDADLRRLGFLRAHSVEEALSQAGLQPGRDAVYGVIDAGNTVVRAGQHPA
ncbi:MAG: lactate racemase domain-containing protein [Phycisphaerae bacterium]